MSHDHDHNHVHDHTCSMATKCQMYRPKATGLFDYADQSATECIKPGLKIRNWIDDMIQNPFNVQRLTEKSYLIGAAGYNAVIHVGKEGVLLISPQSGDATTLTLDGIRSITDLPITDVIYTHYHLDHVAGITSVIEQTRQNSKAELRIHGTDMTARRISKFGGKVPLPNQILRGHDGEFLFEGMPVRIRTPEENGHCPDNAIVVLSSEGITQYDDMLEPEALPFPHFGPAENLVAYEENLRELKTFDWQFINSGHGNIGSRADVDFYIRYLETVRNHTGTIMERLSMTDFMVPTYSYMSAWRNYIAAVSALVKEELRPTYGLYYGFEEVVPTHVEMVLNNLILY